jgi:hypothetical protein
MEKIIRSMLCVAILLFTTTVNAQGDKNQALNTRQAAIVNIASLTAVGSPLISIALTVEFNSVSSDSFLV